MTRLEGLHLAPLRVALLLAATGCVEDRPCQATASCPVVSIDAGPQPSRPLREQPTGLDTDAGLDASSENESPPPEDDLDPVTLSVLPPPAPPETDDAGDSLGDRTGSSDAGDSDGGSTDDDEEDAAPPLPPGACADSPDAPDNGSYDDCAPTLDGDTCELTCDEGFIADGDATCNDGEWSEQTCTPFGTLTAQIGNAADGSNLEDATVYIEGFYNPDTDDCEASAYCTTSAANGTAQFDAFPPGEHQVVIVKDGFDPISLSMSVEPGESLSVRLDALPEGFLQGNIALVLTWEVGGDLDLVLSVPTEDAATCVYHTLRGDLEDTPFAQLDHDDKGGQARGPETLRIALNDAEDGPYYDGTYSVIVSAGGGLMVDAALPTVRLIREGAGGQAEVEVFELPEDAATDTTQWHVLDLDGDGTVTPVGTTEANGTDWSTSELPCVSSVL